MNLKQKRYAVCSALAASAVPSLLMARGHAVETVPEVPLIIDEASESISKTAKAVALPLSVIHAARVVWPGRGAPRE